MALLERDPLLDAVEERLVAVPSDGGALGLIAGEAGVGKTSLVEAICRRWSGKLPVWRGGCDALGTATPLGPVHDIAASVSTVAALSTEDISRHELFQRFLGLLGQPTLVVVEDLHWADDATRDLILFLGRRIRGTRAVILVTYRDESSELKATLGPLAAHAGVFRLEVPPLSREAVAQLAGTEDAAILFERTGGNPFYVTEVLAAPGVTVPTSVRDAVLARVHALSAAAQAVLEAAAVVPRQVDVALLREVSAAADAAIDECEGAGVLRGDGRHVAFRHELARMAVEQATPSARRTRLHAQVHDYLARQPGADPARLAHHAEQAGDGSAVLASGPEAAIRAARVGAHREAADQYARVLRFAEAAPLRQRADLLGRYAIECRATNRIAEAVRASAEAIAAWSALGEVDRHGEQLGRHAMFLWSAGRNVEARAAMTDAIAVLADRPPGPPLLTALAYDAYLRMLARDIPGAIRVGEQAIELASALDQPALLSRALNAVGSAQWFGDPEAAVPILTRSLEVARAAGDDDGVGAALVNLGSGAGEVRRYDTAAHWLLETAAWCEARDLDTTHGYALSWLARVRFEQGRWADATSLAGHPMVERAQYVPVRIVALTVIGRLRVRRGDPNPDEPLDEAWRLSQTAGDLQRLWPAAAGLAELALLRGRTDDAVAAAQSTFDLAVRLGHDWAIGELGYLLWRAGAPPTVPPTVAATMAAPYAAMLSGEPATAARLWYELGCPYEAAEALAETDPEAAYAELTRMGAWPAADVVALRLRQRGVQPRRARRGTRVNPAGLTDREMDVLRLLADDLRNVDVAARLHISPKTVDHHVSAILTKLGVDSRRAAAARFRELDGGTHDGI